jgi:adenylate kinase
VNILLLGPHGAGKSTQAHLLSASLHIPYISTGEMLRVLATQVNETGKQIRARLERGEYMTNEEMIPLVNERLSQIDVKNGFLLEGYPRTLEQAQQLTAPIDLVLNLYLDKEEVVRRLLARHRLDDTPEIIERRLTHYLAEADVILDFYRSRNLLRQVDANDTVENVQRSLLIEIDNIGT